MPEICLFYGIIIRMYLIDNEHPSCHIQVSLEFNNGTVDIDPKTLYRFASSKPKEHAY
jgi:hypothetical protein